MPTTAGGYYFADGATPMSAEDISAAEATAAQGVLGNVLARSVFGAADAVARGAIPTAGLLPGALVYMEDSKTYFSWSGSLWLPPVQPGTVAVVPTSVSGSGVTADAFGLVTFTGATTVIVNGCFTSSFRNYRVVCEATGSAGSHLVNLRAGASNDTSLYDRTENLARNGTVSSATTLNGSNWAVVGAANTLVQWEMDISAPQLAVATTGLSRGGSHSNPAVSNVSNLLAINYLTHRTASAYDGLRVTISAAQSGTLRVYGYN